MLNYTTVIYSVKVGLRLVEQCRQKMREKIRADPLRPVSEVYEEVYNWANCNLDGTDKEEFIAVHPSFKSIESTLYRLIYLFY